MIGMELRISDAIDDIYSYIWRTVLNNIHREINLYEVCQESSRIDVRNYIF